MDICRDLNPREYVDSVTQAASRKLGILNKKRWFFSLLYKSQVRSCLKYCSHLCYGAAQYLLVALDRLQRRAIRIVNSPEATKLLELLQLRRDIASIGVLYH